MKVTLFGKADCCLCDQAKDVLDRASRRVPFELEVVDIARDPALAARFGDEIPVVFVGDRKAFKHRVDEDELVRKLARAGAADEARQAADEARHE
jgi:glutaredoxin